MVDLREFKERGRSLYRQLLKEDLNTMKTIAEGARYVDAPEAQEEYDYLERNCGTWKKLIKLNQ